MENKHGVKISQTIFKRMNYLDYGGLIIMIKFIVRQNISKDNREDK